MEFHFVGTVEFGLKSPTLAGIMLNNSISQDHPQVHPPHFCQSCYCSMKQFTKAARDGASYCSGLSDFSVRAVEALEHKLFTYCTHTYQVCDHFPKGKLQGQKEMWSQLPWTSPLLSWLPRLRDKPMTCLVWSVLEQLACGNNSCCCPISCLCCYNHQLDNIDPSHKLTFWSSCNL